MAETSSETRWYAADVATFGDRLAGAREASGLSQDDLAQRLGVRLTTLQNWEDDLAEPRGNRLQMLAGMLNVSLRWLLIAEGDGLPDPDEMTRPLAAEAEAALAELQHLRVGVIALADKLSEVERKVRLAMHAAA